MDPRPYQSTGYQNVMSIAPSYQQGNIFGYQIRNKLSPSELEFFKNSHRVGGYAADDKSIVLNPFSPLNDYQRMAVATNEAIRQYAMENKVDIPFTLTKEQSAQFIGTPYEKDKSAQKATIAARIITGDPSALDPTPEQLDFSYKLFDQITGKK